MKRSKLLNQEVINVINFDAEEICDKSLVINCKINLILEIHFFLNLDAFVTTIKLFSPIIIVVEYNILHPYNILYYNHIVI